MTDFKKLAQALLDLGDPVTVGQEIAGVIGFIFRSVPAEDRLQALEALQLKLAQLNVSDIASKSAPPSAAIGQSITFVKTVLNGLPYNYIKTVLNSATRTLGGMG
jgi:hypothetical protein